MTALSLIQIGETTSSDDHNLSLDRLAKDLKNVLHAAYGEHLPDIVLVGHRYVCLIHFKLVYAAGTSFNNLLRLLILAIAWVDQLYARQPPVG